MNARRTACCTCLMLLMLASGPAAAQFFSGPDPEWREMEPDWPASPADATLRSFFVSAASPNRFFVDEATLTVGEDGVVRYVLVVQASGGAETVSFEGIRCATGERRLYATAREDGSWAAVHNSKWRPIPDATYNRPRAVLAWQHFCDGMAAPRSRKAALAGLRDGLRQLE